MAEPFNPFEHHHAHHHDDEELPEQMDPAQRALNDALRVSFGLLKVIMFIVVVWYLFSGMKKIDSKEVAVRLRFGAIVQDRDDPRSALLERGLNFTWPFPIERVVRLSTVQQNTTLEGQYFFDMTGNEDQTLDAQAFRKNELDPVKDGSLLTGDANIVHARWQVRYQINAEEDPQAAIDFIANIGDTALLEPLVQYAAQQGVVYACARAEADEFIRDPRTVNMEAAQRAQDILKELHSGITIARIVAQTPTVPGKVRPDYFAVTNALSEQASEKEKARQQRDEILGRTAGEAWEPLWQMVQDYELAREQGDQAAADAAEQRLYTAFAALNTGPEAGGNAITGDVAEVISQAKSFRTEVVTRVQADANQFQQLVDKYNENPKLYIAQSWLEMWQELAKGELVEMYFVKDDDILRLNVKRDPRMKQILENWRSELDRLRREQEQQSNR